MNFAKKITALFIAAVMLISLAGCADVSYAMKVNDTTIKSGVYIYYMNQAQTDAISKLQTDYPDVDTSAEGFTPYSYQLDGISYEQWVVNETETLCRRYVSVEEQFNALGLSFTDDEKSQTKNDVNDFWDTENPYYAYYGINATTGGGYFEDLGISKSSYQSVYVNSKKETKIFDYYYAKDGVEAVAEDEFLTYMKDTYARYRMITVALTDANDEKVTTEEGLKVLEDKANEYVASLNNGELFSTVKKSYEDWVAEQKAAAEAAEDTTDEAAEDTTDEAAEETPAEEEAIDENTNDVIALKTSTSPSAEIVAHIFEMENNKAELYKAEDNYYVIVRLDITENADTVEKYREVSIYQLRKDAFTEKLSAIYSGFTVDKNQASIDKYMPSKLK